MWQTNARAQHSLCPCSTFIWLLHSAPNYAHGNSLSLMELEGIFCLAYCFFGVSITLKSETYRDETSSTSDEMEIHYHIWEWEWERNFCTQIVW